MISLRVISERVDATKLAGVALSKASIVEF